MDATDARHHLSYLKHMAQTAWANVHHATNKGDEERYRRYAVALDNAITECQKIILFLDSQPEPKKKRP